METHKIAIVFILPTIIFIIYAVWFAARDVIIHDPRSQYKTIETSAEDSVKNNKKNQLAYFDINDQYKILFADAMQGFSHYAKLKGYNVSITIDPSLPGKIGIKFVILDAESIVGPADVQKDVDEYIRKIKNSDDLRDMPIVTDPIEHERLVAALSMRFSYMKNEVELHKAQAAAYQNMLNSVNTIVKDSVSYYSKSNSPLHVQFYNEGINNMSRDTFSAEHSPGASVGTGNTTRTEGSSIIIGSSNEQHAYQMASIDALIRLVKKSKLEEGQKTRALRHLENVREEVTSSEKPDRGLIANSLDRLRMLLQAANLGADFYQKAKELFASFGIAY